MRKAHRAYSIIEKATGKRVGSTYDKLVQVGGGHRFLFINENKGRYLLKPWG